MKIDAKIISDSLNVSGDRLTTFELTFPRIILPEILTHRMFSRNTSSSRAIPFMKMYNAVKDNPFIPVAFQKTHKGMQGYNYLTDDEEARNEWLNARDEALKVSNSLHELGITKQLCNRILEPFMWTKMILTSSEEGLRNFFELRCPTYEYYNGDPEPDYIHRDRWEYKHHLVDWDFCPNLDDDPEWIKLSNSTAEIHIQFLAELMYNLYRNSVPDVILDWHIPYSKVIDSEFPTISLEDKIKVAISKIARVSYTNIEENKELSLDKHKELYELLIKEKHMSPLEHVANSCSESVDFYNLRGFKSMRYLVEKNKDI